MFNKKSIIVLFIDRNRFQFYGGSLSGIETLDVPEAQMHDLDIVNRDSFYTLVKQWVKQHALVGAQLILIFAETSYFEKVFSSKEPAELETEIIKFFDTVPFETSITKVYDAPNGKRPVAINKTLYEAIRQGFLLQGLSTRGVLPVSSLGPQGLKRALDRDMGEYVLKNLDTLMRQSIAEAGDLTGGIVHKSEEHAVVQKKKSSLPLLLSIFGVLLVVLVVFIFVF